MRTANGKKQIGTRALRFGGWLWLCLCVWTVPFETLGAQAEPALPEVTLYAAMNATTPQIPLWKMIRSDWPEGYALSVNYWKTLDDLRGIVLAGKGDIWVGHLEGFAQAARRGAPVTMAAITGWKKFYLVSQGGRNGSSPFAWEEIAADLRRQALPLPVAPRESPAAGILESMARRGGPSFILAPMPTQQLMLEMLRGKQPYAVLPEPLVSALIAKDKNIRVLAGLEEEYARRFGGEHRLPWVGIAVHKDFAAKNPAFMLSFMQKLQQAAKDVAGNAQASVDALPEQVVSLLGREVLLDSLRRDMVLVVPAQEARREIEDFLRLTLPEMQTPGAVEALMNAGFLFTEEQ
jgi:NitT/TauT family transport system substrate-binding protein